MRTTVLPPNSHCDPDKLTSAQKEVLNVIQFGHIYERLQQYFLDPLGSDLERVC